MGMSRDEYWRAVDRERQAGKRAVNALLDDLCVRWGYPPGQYRVWREEEQRERIRESFRRFNEACVVMGEAMKRRMRGLP